ncbi:uncharacterized protein LOC113351828 [Papaver somniferum]|uniref:uncharacterized protein LOC113351828 n=1 Tax=Papaver somniferum TaxID=3469 RepID=UPI000E6FCAD0|nr:uncharacterized protein LOC113351828 [Papaver somniferum]
MCENYDINAPWALIGDLNLTLHDNERSNSNGSSSRASKLAQTVLETILNDLGFHGNSYTWTSNKHGTWNIGTSSKNWKFFECWLRDNSCKLEIEKAWSASFNGSAGFILDKKLTETRITLSIWNKAIVGNIQTKIKDLQQHLIDLQRPNSVQDNTQLANKRRTRNIIETLQKPDGSWCNGRYNLEELLNSHFKNIMSTSNPPSNSALLDLLPTCITDADNKALTKILDEVEITSVLKCMQPWKAPGPDGFPPGFFKDNGQLLRMMLSRWCSLSLSLADY